MKNPVVYLKNVAKIVVLKIRYRKKISVGIIQSFERVRFDIRNNGRIQIGNYNQNRGNLYMGASGGTLSIGDHCFFNINSSITCLESVSIGNNCKFGNNLVIVDHDHNFRSNKPEFVSTPIRIGNNVWCGAGVTILRGTIIGDNCVIAAGCTVKGNIEEGTLLIPEGKNIKKILGGGNTDLSII